MLITFVVCVYSLIFGFRGILYVTILWKISDLSHKIYNMIINKKSCTIIFLLLPETTSYSIISNKHTNINHKSFKNKYYKEEKVLVSQSR